MRRVYNKSGIRAERAKRIDVFSKELTPASLYSLGVFASDGVMHKDKMERKHVHFVGDLDVIKKIQKILGSDAKIQTRPDWKHTRALHFINQYMYDSLQKLGMSDRKTFTGVYPKIPTDYETQRHFIRGFFDGDGSVYPKKDGKRRIFIECEFVDGSLGFISTLREFLISFGIPVSKISRPSGKNWHRIFVKHNGSLLLYKFLYDGVPETISGDRKRARFKGLIAQTEGGKLPSFKEKFCKECGIKLLYKNLSILRHKEFCTHGCRFNYLYHTNKKFREKFLARTRARYHRYKQLGLCTKCGMKTDKGTLCKKHSRRG